MAIQPQKTVLHREPAAAEQKKRLSDSAMLHHVLNTQETHDIRVPAVVTERGRLEYCN